MTTDVYPRENCITPAIVLFILFSDVRALLREPREEVGGAPEKGTTTHTHGRSPGAEHGQARAGGGVVSHSARGPRGRVGEAAPQGERSGADEEHTRNESAATGPEATDGTGRTRSGSGGGTGVRQAEDERRAMPGAHHNKQRYGIQEYITERGEPMALSHSRASQWPAAVTADAIGTSGATKDVRAKEGDRLGGGGVAGGVRCASVAVAGGAHRPRPAAAPVIAQLKKARLLSVCNPLWLR
jgi:hypothetical protein